MIYKIDSDYYIYRDRKYIKIIAKLDGDEVSLVPDTNNKFIEDNGNVKAKNITINDIKKDLQEKVNDDKETIRSKYKYSRDR
jgi:hypothetical protein